MQSRPQTRSRTERQDVAEVEPPHSIVASSSSPRGHAVQSGSAETATDEVAGAKSRQVGGEEVQAFRPQGYQER
ncbi:hypothetical protein Emag_007691 [Eimeria magna]